MFKGNVTLVAITETINSSDAGDRIFWLLGPTHTCWCPGSLSRLHISRHGIESIRSAMCSVAPLWIYSSIEHNIWLIWNVNASFIIFKNNSVCLRVKLVPSQQLMWNQVPHLRMSWQGWKGTSLPGDMPYCQFIWHYLSWIIQSWGGS